MRNNLMLLHLSNERTVCVGTVDKFPPIDRLRPEQRADFDVIDNQYLSFLAIDEVYNVRELIRIE